MLSTLWRSSLPLPSLLSVTPSHGAKCPRNAVDQVLPFLLKALTRTLTPADVVNSRMLPAVPEPAELPPVRLSVVGTQTGGGAIVMVQLLVFVPADVPEFSFT